MELVTFYIFILLFLEAKLRKIEVNVKQGKILGTTGTTVFNGRLYYAFYGVPYAQTPVGKLRFKDPEPPKKWKHHFDARTEYHGACAQAHIVHKHGVYGFEDCLTLNIYTPHLPGNNIDYLKAVVVWIHGYAFTSSFSHIYSGDFLLDNDIIFVSVTHRLGVFGFLKVNESESDANMGLKDIVMSLKWIKKNIKKFGGDKNKITVMGSGSASTLLSLLFITKYRKLFSKMILQSGTMFSPSLFQGDPSLEAYRLREVLKKRGFNNLMKTSTKDIINASQKIYSNKEIINLQRPLIPFLPTIETKSNKSIITIRMKEFYKDIHKPYINTPILIGFNTQESISEVIPFLRNPKLLNSFSSFFKFMVPFNDGCRIDYGSKMYQEIAEKIKSRYFKQGISENYVENFVRYTSDLHIYPIYKFVQKYLHPAAGNMYVYKFNYIGRFNVIKTTSTADSKIKVKGASSGDEICYILKCEPIWENYIKLNNSTENHDKIFIKNITKMWANFIKDSNPTPSYDPAKVKWLPMTPTEDNMLYIGKVSKLIRSKQEQNMFKFWNEIYDSYYSLKRCASTNIHDEM